MLAITNSEFIEQVFNIFDKIKTDERDFISIICVDDIDGKFVIEIGRTFSFGLDCFSIKLEIYKNSILNTFSNITNFVDALYKQYQRLNFIEIMEPQNLMISIDERRKNNIIYE